VKLIDEAFGKFYTKREINQNDKQTARIKKEPKCDALHNTELIPLEIHN